MKPNINSISPEKIDSIFGKKPTLNKPLPVGQLNIPDRERLEDSFKRIFSNKYYNNNGPLHQELESILSDMLGVKYAICVHNASLGLMIVSDCIKPSNVIMPSFTFVSTLQSQLWCNVPIELSDVSLDDASMPVTEKLYERANRNTLIMPVNLWSGCSKIADYDHLHEATGANIVYDSAPAFGVEYEGKKLGGRGLAEVFSFHATKIINATEGGVITTNNDDLARKIRAKVPSYPAGSFVSDRVANCRFSEAQAAMALLSLADFEKNVARNKNQFDMYVSAINPIEGLSVWHPANCTRSNYASLVVVVDEVAFGASRDKIISHLKAENVLARRYYFPGIDQVVTHQTLSHLSETMQNTHRLSQTAMQLPLGGLVSAENIQAIADIINKIRHFYS